MFNSVFTKTMYDKRWFLLGWALGGATLLGLTALFFPTFKQSGLDQALQSIPAGLQNLTGDISSYAQFDGYLGNAVYGLRAQMLFIPLTIILGISLSVGEESSRKLYQLVAQPVSRLSIAFQKWLAGAFIVTIIVAALYGAIALVALTIGESVPFELLNKISIMSALFLLMMFTVVYGIGLATGRKTVALAISIVWTMASFLIDSFAASIDWLKQIEWSSIFMYYDTMSLTESALDINHIVILAGLTAVFLMLGLLVFPNRDLREESA